MIFTFYSYKGGVGRSLALACVAQVFAERGLKVLAVDFDLEAPGLERYFFDGDEARRRRAQPGLVDLVLTYRRALTDAAEFERAEFRNWRRYAQTVRDPVNTLAGTLSVMTAGRREPAERLRDYALAVRSFDWQDFFHNWKGDRFFEWLGRQWNDPATGFDVVLVDSRTGVTEMGGVCAYQLADAAVLLCAPNYQNLDGTRDVVRDFLSEGVLALRHGRELDILALPARLATDHPKREQFLADFESALGTDGLPAVLALANAGLSYRSLALAYDEAFAVSERLVGETPADDGGAFTRLADALTLLARDADCALGRQKDAALARLRGEQAVDAAARIEADTTRTSAGYDVFLDVGAADREAGDTLRRLIDSAGLRVVRPDPDAAGAGGGGWSELLELALRYSQRLLVCFGADSRSPWREAAIAGARANGRTQIVPVLLPGAEESALRAYGLEGLHAIDLRHGWGEGGFLVTHLGAGARRAAPPTASELRAASQAQAAAADAPARDPYPGARPYTEDDAAAFFGRTKEVDALLDALREPGVVVLHGPAGTGKTSLVHAGLLPRLRRGDDERVRALGLPAAWPIVDARRAWPRPLPQVGFGLLVIDHLDSTFGREHLDALKPWLAGIGPRDRVVLVLRGGLATIEHGFFDNPLRPWHQVDVPLAALEGDALREAIEAPARKAGHLLEPGLTERLVESAGHARSRMVQIQLALAELWRARQRGWLTNKALDAAGHLGGLFVAHRKDAVAALSPQWRSAAQVLFKTLTVIDGQQRQVPRALPWAEVAGVPAIAAAGADALRDALADAGLLDLYREDLDFAPDLGCPAEVALVRPDAAQYFDDGPGIADLAFRLWRSDFASFVRAWMHNPGELLAGRTLDDAEHWLAERAAELMAAEAALIRASIEARDAAAQREEAERQAALDNAQRLAQAEHARAEAEAAAAAQARAAEQVQKKRALQLTGTTIGGLAMAAAAAVGWYQVQRESTERERALRAAVVLNAASEGQATLLKLRPGSDVRALLQLVAARRMSDDPQIGSLLAEGLLAQPALRGIVDLEGDAGIAYAVAPDGSQVAYVDKAGRLVLHDLAGGTRRSPEEPVARPGAKGVSIVYRDAARVVLRNGAVGTVSQFDLRTGEFSPLARGLPPGDTGSWSIGPRHLAWVDGGQLHLKPLGAAADAPAAVVAGLATTSVHGFDPSGSRVLARSEDGDLRVVDVDRARPGRAIGPIVGSITARYSPDGKRIAASNGESVVVWNAADYKREASYQVAPERGFGQLAFSAGGRRLAVVASDRSLNIWDFEGGRSIGRAARGHEIGAVAFAPDGSSVWTAGTDGTARRWDARLQLPFGRLLDGPAGRTWAVAFSDDGKRLYSGGADGRLWSWTVADGTRAMPPRRAVAGDGEHVMAVAAAGGDVACATSAGAVLRWGSDTMEPAQRSRVEAGGTAWGMSWLGDRSLVVATDHALARFGAGAPTSVKAPAPISSMTAHAPRDLVATGHADARVRLWQGSTLQPQGGAIALEAGASRAALRVDMLAMRPDGREVAVAADGVYRLDVEARTARRVPLEGVRSTWSLAYSPDSRILATGTSGGEVRLWDAVSTAALTPAIKLPTGLKRGTDPSLDQGAATALAFSADRRWLAVAGDAGVLWLMPHPDRWIDEACARAGRNLSQAEWERWISPALAYVEQCPGLPKP